MTETKCDLEYRTARPFYVPSVKSFGEVQDEVMSNIRKRNRLPRTYKDKDFTRTFTVRDIVPIFYGWGIVDCELYVDIKIDDGQGRNLGLQQRIYVGAYCKDTDIREAIPNGAQYYNDTNREISDLLKDSVNKK